MAARAIPPRRFTRAKPLRHPLPTVEFEPAPPTGLRALRGPECGARASTSVSADRSTGAGALVALTAAGPRCLRSESRARARPRRCPCSNPGCGTEIVGDIAVERDRVAQLVAQSNLRPGQQAVLQPGP